MKAKNAEALMIQFHVLESAIRPADQPAGVVTPEYVSPPDSGYRHLAESMLDVIRKETFCVDVGPDSGLTVEEYQRFLGWLRLTLEQHVHELASGSTR
jgi:hypothetical protein